jgi:hypothetical protein
MCDPASLYAFLGTAGGLIAGAIVAIGVAAALNNGFFSAPGSPAAMITAGGLTVAAGGKEKDTHLVVDALAVAA